MKPQALVISLRRTPERLAWFLDANKSLKDPIQWVEGIDGQQLGSSLSLSRLVSDSAQRHWTPGAIGSALSHWYCWRQCLERKEPILILEDDAVLADDWQQQLATSGLDQLKNWDLLLLGWNYNSVLHSQNQFGIEAIRLFEPAFPRLDEIRRLLSPGRQLQLERLKHAFGLPAYLISPEGAEKLLASVPPLATTTCTMPRGIPTTETVTLDGMLNLHYPGINAWVMNPPLAVALNDPKSSLTLARPSPLDFGH